MDFHLPHFGSHEAKPTIAQASNPETEPAQDAVYARTDGDNQAEKAADAAAEKWGVADKPEESVAQPVSEAAPVAELPEAASPEAQPTEAVTVPEEQAPADTDHQIPA
jgi:hypothetical protein